MRPPTKREQNRQLRRAVIIDVAISLFLENGYAATTMSTIASALGGSKGTLWAYFDSKEEVFAAVVDALTTRLQEDLYAGLQPENFSVANFQAFCTNYLDMLMSDGPTRLSRLIIGEGGRFPELQIIFYDRGFTYVNVQLEQFLAPSLGSKEAERVALLTVSLLIGYRLQALFDPTLEALACSRTFIADAVPRLLFLEESELSE
jgi:AcrR family transcriptional regulator